MAYSTWTSSAVLHYLNTEKNKIMPDKTETEAKMDIASLEEASKLRLKEGSAPYVVLPCNYRVDSLEHLLPSPLRIKANPVFWDVASWTDYVKAFRMEGTRTWINPCDSNHNMVVTAVLDYPAPNSPRWQSHYATLTIERSTQWKTWAGICGKWMSQADMSEFIADNIPDIAKPAGAEMLEIAQTLNIRNNVEFESSHLISNGQVKLVYRENVAGTAGKDGALQIPSDISLGIPVFNHTRPYEVPCRLRYRLEGKRLSLMIKRVRPQAIVDACVESIRNDITEDLGTAPAFGKIHINQ